MHVVLPIAIFDAAGQADADDRPIMPSWFRAPA
jgi:hypothetical protein